MSWSSRRKVLWKLLVVSFLPHPQPLSLFIETGERKLTGEQKGDIEAPIKGAEVEGQRCSWEPEGRWGHHLSQWLFLARVPNFRSSGHSWAYNQRLLGERGHKREEERGVFIRRREKDALGQTGLCLEGTGPCLWTRVCGWELRWGPGTSGSGWPSVLPVGTAPFGNHSTGDFDDGFLRRKQRRNRTTFTLQQVMSLLRLSYFLRPKKKPKKSEFQRLFFVFSKTSTECVNQIFPFAWTIYVSRTGARGQMTLTLWSQIVSEEASQ